MTDISSASSSPSATSMASMILSGSHDTLHDSLQSKSMSKSMLSILNTTVSPVGSEGDERMKKLVLDHDGVLNSSPPSPFNTTKSDDMVPFLSLNVSHDIWAQNDLYARHMIPAMVFVGILMVIGLPGNCLVVYVYGFRFKSATQNVLIVTLACLDLIMCIVAMPTEIADIRFHHTFTSEFACKLLRFITMYVSLSSCLTLISVAYDRHRRITQPLSRQLTPRMAKTWVVLNLLGGMCLSWPTLIMTGLKTSETEIPGLKGKDCSFSETFTNTRYPFIFNTFLALSFFIVTAILSVLYFRIWKAAKSRKMNMAKRYTITSLSDCSQNEVRSDAVIESSQRDILRLLRKQASIDNTTFAKHHANRLACPRRSEGLNYDVPENGTLTNISLSNGNICRNSVLHACAGADTQNSCNPHEFQSLYNCMERQDHLKMHDSHDVQTCDKNPKTETPTNQIITSCPDLLESIHHEADGQVNKQFQRRNLSLLARKYSTHITPSSLCPFHSAPPSPSLDTTGHFFLSDSTSNTEEQLVDASSCSECRKKKNEPPTNKFQEKDDEIHNKEAVRDSFNFDDYEHSLTTYIGNRNATEAGEVTRKNTLTSIDYLELDIIKLSDTVSQNALPLTSQPSRSNRTKDLQLDQDTEHSRLKNSTCDLPPHPYLADQFMNECFDDINEDEEDRRISADFCMDSFSHLIGPRSKPISIVEESFDPIHDSRRKKDLEVSNHDFNHSRNKKTHDEEDCFVDRRLGGGQDIVRYYRVRNQSFSDGNRIRASNASDDFSVQSQLTELTAVSCQSINGSSKTPKSTRPKDRSQSLSSTLELESCYSTSVKKRRCLFGSLDKTTVVALAVSLVFVLSFLPYLIVMAIRGLDKRYYASLDWASLCITQIFVRFYLLNSASNPILYGLLNPNFRRECSSKWRRLTSSCWSKPKNNQS